MNRRHFLRNILIAAATPAIIVSALTSAGVTPRKLKAMWSIELEQDLKSYHGIDSDQLAAIMSDEIQKEIDDEILKLMHQEAAKII